MLSSEKMEVKLVGKRKPTKRQEGSEPMALIKAACSPCFHPGGEQPLDLSLVARTYLSPLIFCWAGGYAFSLGCELGRSGQDCIIALYSAFGGDYAQFFIFGQTFQLQFNSSSLLLHKS